MKRIKLIVLSIIVIFVSCEKDKLPVDEISEFKKIMKFSKEIVVTDSTSRNSVFLRIHSNDEKLLENYIASNDFVIETFGIEQDFSLYTNERVLVPNETPDLEKEYSFSLTNFSSSRNEDIQIEVVTANFENNIKGYYLNTIPNNAALKVYRWDIIISYTTPNRFLGVVHTGGGHSFAVRMYYWTSWWQFNFGSATQITQNGANTFFLWPTGGQYYAWMDFESYRKRIIVNQWHDDVINGITNYRFANHIDNFRGKSCSYIGSYDGYNCYVGTAPEGTTAFIWNNRFYHSPLPGNVCPIPGSHFDGANCRVVAIPEGTTPFIWNNSWYVLPDHIWD